MQILAQCGFDQNCSPCEEGRCHRRVPCFGGIPGRGPETGLRTWVTIRFLTGCQLDAIRDLSFCLRISTVVKFTVNNLSENLPGQLLPLLQEKVKYSNHFF